jgi:hypothetical protein
MSSGIPLFAPPGRSKFTPGSKIERRYQSFMQDSGGRAPVAGFALSVAKDVR